MGPFFREKIAKIVISDQGRVNGGSNYMYPGQNWVLKLVEYMFYRWRRSKFKEQLQSSAYSKIPETYHFLLNKVFIVSLNVNALFSII